MSRLKGKRSGVHTYSKMRLCKHDRALSVVETHRTQAESVGEPMVGRPTLRPHENGLPENLRSCIAVGKQTDGQSWESEQLLMQVYTLLQKHLKKD